MQLYPTQTKSIQLKASQATHSDKCDLLKPTHIPRRPCEIFPDFKTYLHGNEP